jgi:TonB family protein
VHPVQPLKVGWPYAVERRAVLFVAVLERFLYSSEYSYQGSAMTLRALLLACIIQGLAVAGIAQSESGKPYFVCGPEHQPENGPCATAPRATFTPNPGYAEEARQNRIEGTVVLWLIVGPDGTPHDIKVSRALGHGLDEKAIDAVKHWRFDPATVDGKPVPVQINVEVNFRLYGKDDSASSPGPLAMQDAAALFTKAYNAQGAHDCGTAIALATRVTEIVPRHWEAWNLLGRCYLELDELPEAERAFKRQIEVVPQHAYAYNNLGTVYLRRREYDKAAAEFRKQLQTNPRDHYSLTNLATALQDQKKYKEAVTAYQDAANVMPDNVEIYRGLLDCYLELGMQDEATKAMDKTAALTSSASGWNSLAWTLARHNTQLDRAERYAKLSISLASSNMTAVSLDPLTPHVYGRVNSLAATWDTLGWILFLRGDAAVAEKYMLASWRLSPNPTIGDHLAQIYEKLGHKDQALKYSSLAIAALEDQPFPPNDDLAASVDARERFARLAPSANAKQAVQDAAQILHSENSVAIPNQANQTGKAEFAILQAPDLTTSQARLISGDGSLGGFTATVATKTPRVPIPGDEPVDLARWATLTCSTAEVPCSLKIATAREAAVAQLQSTIKPTAAAPASDPGAYSSESLGIALRLPEGWSKTSESAATPTTPGTVVFARNDALCALMVIRYHLEATEATFNTLFDSALKNNESSHQLSKASVVRNGIGGVRMIVNYAYNDVEMHAFIETFTAGDVHYQLIAVAPLDQFERYAAEIETLLGSIRFPSLHVDAKDIKP